MTAFKICGLRDVDNALVAARAGATLIGFVFVEGVRRRIDPQRGAEIIAECRAALGDGCPSVVGLFANQPVEFVNAVARECELDFAQLCGDEPPSMWSAMELPVIRQVKVREDLPRRETVELARRQVAEAVDAGNRALLDKHQRGALGGTGVAFDWSIARAIASERPALLAGGLTPSNVGEAISVVRPWGVDVSTGVETNGVKDAAKIRAFAEAVGRADGGG